MVEASVGSDVTTMVVKLSQPNLSVDNLSGAANICVEYERFCVLHILQKSYLEWISFKD